MTKVGVYKSIGYKTPPLIVFIDCGRIKNKIIDHFFIGKAK
jgi:hypothetical protein